MNTQLIYHEPAKGESFSFKVDRALGKQTRASAILTANAVGLEPPPK